MAWRAVVWLSPIMSLKFWCLLLVKEHLIIDQPILGTLWWANIQFWKLFRASVHRRTSARSDCGTSNRSMCICPFPFPKVIFLGMWKSSLPQHPLASLKSVDRHSFDKLIEQYCTNPSNTRRNIAIPTMPREPVGSSIGSLTSFSSLAFLTHPPACLTATISRSCMCLRIVSASIEGVGETLGGRRGASFDSMEALEDDESPLILPLHTLQEKKSVTITTASAMMGNKATMITFSPEELCAPL